MPVAIIAREPRGLEGEHRTHMLIAHRGHEALEAGTGGAARARAAEVIVDDLHPLPAPRARMLGQGVLPPLTFEVLVHLRHRGLAHVHIRGALEMLRGDLSRDEGAHASRSPRECAADV